MRSGYELLRALLIGLGAALYEDGSRKKLARLRLDLVACLDDRLLECGKLALIIDIRLVKLEPGVLRAFPIEQVVSF